MAGLSLACSACAEQSAPLRVERVHDLVSMLPSAEATGRHPYTLGLRPDIDNEVDDRDGIVYIRAANEAAYTFRELSTSGAAELSFGIGVLLEQGGQQTPKPGPITFRIEAMEADATHGAFITVFEESHPAAYFPAPELRTDHRLTLPDPALDVLQNDAGAKNRDGPERHWTLRFSSALTSGGQGRRTWPGWFQPVLRSQGRLASLEERAVPTRHVALDLLQAFDSAQVLQESAAAAVRRAPLDAAEGVNVHGGPRNSLAATAPSRIAWELDIPRSATLDFACGMDTHSGWMLPGDGMSFAVEVNGERIWSRFLNGHEVELERGWKPASLDLSPWAGQRVSLELITETGEDGEHDAGAWAHPRILEAGETPRRAAGDGPNVLLIVIDTLRADALGCYGAPGNPTPRLDALAAQGVFFSQSRSVSSFTWPATGSILTGLYPHAHGVVGRKRAFLADHLETLAELFTADGYSTGAFVANPIVGSATNFHQGFESFANLPQARARALNERVMLWTENQQGAAVMAYVHYFDPHDPYLPPAEFRPELEIDAVSTALDDVSIRHLTALKGDDVDASWDAEKVDLFGRSVRLDELLYEAEVRYTDAAIGELIDAWQAAGLLDDALVVVTADHGEEFYEHGRPYHGTHLWEESIRVPLWVTGFGKSAFPGRRVDTPTSVVDILPTLLEALGLEAPPYDLPGRSLLDSFSTEPSFAHTASGLELGFEGALDRLCATLPPWKLIWTPGAELAQLYKLDEDPREAVDVAAQHPDVVARLKGAIDAWLEASIRAAPEHDGAVGQEMQSWLEALGYTGR